ncbi:MAG: hypothetical protein ACOCSJ_03905 [Candidatus Natronoplasma sp.]
MGETWDEGPENKLGKKRCSVCGERLQIGKVFILKEGKFFHERCYREKKAEQLKKGKIEMDELTERSQERSNEDFYKPSLGERADRYEGWGRKNYN